MGPLVREAPKLTWAENGVPKLELGNEGQKNGVFMAYSVCHKFMPLADF